MNILFVSGIYPPDIGGPATYVSNMADALRTLGHSVYVLTLAVNKESVPGPFPVHKVPRGKNIVLRVFRMLREALKLAKKVDIVYSTGSPWDSWFVSLLVARLCKKKLVIKVVGDAVWEWAQRKKITQLLMGEFDQQNEKPIIEILKGLRNSIAKRADVIITPSYFLKGIVKGWGVPPNKIRVIYNAIEDLHDNAPLDSEDRRTIATVARLMPWKGIDGLIRIAKRLPDDVKIVVVGDGPLLEFLKKTAQDEGAEERVLFTGRLPKDGVRRILLRSSVFVLNSRYEGFPHTILEAMTLRIPVVATKVGGNIELVKDGENGFLVPVGNERMLAEKIKCLLENKDLRKRFASEASKTVDRMKWPHVVSRTEGLLEDLVS